MSIMIRSKYVPVQWKQLSLFDSLQPGRIDLCSIDELPLTDLPTLLHRFSADPRALGAFGKPEPLYLDNTNVGTLEDRLQARNDIKQEMIKRFWLMPEEVRSKFSGSPEQFCHFVENGDLSDLRALDEAVKQASSPIEEKPASADKEDLSPVSPEGE